MQNDDRDSGRSPATRMLTGLRDLIKGGLAERFAVGIALFGSGNSISLTVATLHRSLLRVFISHTVPHDPTTEAGCSSWAKLKARVKIRRKSESLQHWRDSQHAMPYLPNARWVANQRKLRPTKEGRYLWHSETGFPVCGPVVHVAKGWPWRQFSGRNLGTGRNLFAQTKVARNGIHFRISEVSIPPFRPVPVSYRHTYTHKRVSSSDGKWLSWPSIELPFPSCFIEGVLQHWGGSMEMVW